MRSSIWDPQYNGWSPRVGIAYSITPKTVIRAGFSIFDDHNAFDKEMQDPRGSFPVGGSYNSPSNLNRGIPTVFFDGLPTTAEMANGTALAINRAANPNVKIPYVMEYNLGVQRQVMENTDLEINYVGSGSRHLWGSYGYNEPLPGTYGPNALPGGQPFPFIPGIIQANDNTFTASYNALQVKLDHRYSHGLLFATSYTYSKCMNTVGGEYDSFPEDSYNFSLDHGSCNSDVPQLFSFSPVYLIPVGKGQRFGGNIGKGLDLLVGGWNVSNITSIHSGLPFSVTESSDIANVGVTGRSNSLPGCKLHPNGFKQGIQGWYDPSCFITPPNYTFGQTVRNGYRGPSYADADFALMKAFRITESKSIQIRAEGFNAFNHTNLSNPSAGRISGSNAVQTSFMHIYSAGTAREIQFAGKFIF